MFYFTKQEKIVILFLTGAIIFGLGIQWLRANGNLPVDSIKIGKKAKSVNSPNGKKININSASIDKLDTLPGIGPKIAADIINYRKERGEFKSIEDIKKVRGIGKKKFEKIKDKICISDVN